MCCQHLFGAMKLLFVLLLSGACSGQWQPTGLEVQTESGKVIGSTVYHRGIPVKRFLSIPYAQPPVGDLRFRRTVPVRPWTETLAAYDWPPACVQYYPVPYPWIDDASREDEDCLYLNIWVPQTGNEQRLKAVMFWIYGGGFSAGSTNLPIHDGHVLAAEGDVIVVTVNYRLGVFGFLSTFSESAPGNMGLYDILEAFQWTRNNIEAFGGDKNRVTVFGHSVGSLVAVYFAVSPLTKGLFQRIILQSGAPSDKSKPFEKNFKLGDKVAETAGCAPSNMTLKTDPEQIVECMRGIPPLILHQKVLQVHPKAGRGFLPIYGDAFLPERPTDAIKRGRFHDVSAMTGNVKDEGSVTLINKFPEITGYFGAKDPKINRTFAEDIILQSLADVDGKSEIADYYLSGLEEHDYDAVRRQVYHSMGDFNIFCPQLYLSEKLSGSGKDVYFYYLYHRMRPDVFAEWAGVTHLTEVPFVFGRPLVNTSAYTAPEGRLSEAIMRFWSNFAKCGVPSLEWKKFSKSQPYVEHLHIYNDPDNYLAEHFKNCNFLRKYFDFS